MASRKSSVTRNHQVSDVSHADAIDSTETLDEDLADLADTIVGGQCILFTGPDLAQVEAPQDFRRTNIKWSNIPWRDVPWEHIPWQDIAPGGVPSSDIPWADIDWEKIAWEDISSENASAISVNDVVAGKLRFALDTPENVAADAGLAHVGQVYLREDPNTRGRRRLTRIVSETLSQFDGRTSPVHEK